MKKKHYHSDRLHDRLQSAIFVYSSNGMSNRLHTPLYIGGVASSHLCSQYNSSHLFKNHLWK